MEISCSARYTRHFKLAVATNVTQLQNFSRQVFRNVREKIINLIMKEFKHGIRQRKDKYQEKGLNSCKNELWMNILLLKMQLSNPTVLKVESC